MRTMVLAVLFWVLLMGCRAAQPGYDYAVWVSPEFSDGQQADIKGAMLDWQRVTPVQFNAYLPECSDADYTICISPIHGVKAVGTIGRDSNGDDGQAHADIALDIDWEGSLRQVASHELGHAMGLPHAEKGTVMCWITDCAAPVVTERDAEHWRASR